VSLFVLSPEIEDRDEVEVDSWVKGIKWNFLFAARVIITGGMTRHCHFKSKSNLSTKKQGQNRATKSERRYEIMVELGGNCSST
jgi:hypothetical protein